MKLPQKGETWKHFKGGVYTILEIGWMAEEELEVCVVYVTAGGTTFMRRLNNFMELVDSGPRFTYCAPGCISERTGGDTAPGADARMPEPG